MSDLPYHVPNRPLPPISIAGAVASGPPKITGLHYIWRPGYISLTLDADTVLGHLSYILYMADDGRKKLKFTLSGKPAVSPDMLNMAVPVPWEGNDSNVQDIYERELGTLAQAAVENWLRMTANSYVTRFYNRR